MKSSASISFHPDRTLPPPGADWIWVFGSNLAGRHGAGAAKVAKLQFGARYGEGRGPTGMAYGIPTKDAHLNVLPLTEIEQSIADFLLYARTFPEKSFFVTRIGCELAGYQDEQIAPLFAGAPGNCSLPAPWKSYVQRTADPLGDLL